MKNKDQQPLPGNPSSRPGSPAPVARLATEWLQAVLDSECAPAPELRRVRPGDGGAGPGGQERTAANRLPERLFSADPFEVSARYTRGEVDTALWYREWHREWRRFQVADQFHRFLDDLSRAGTPDEVFRTLSEHAVRIVGGYTCLLFPPQEQTPLRPLPNPALQIDEGHLTLSIPLAQPGLISRDEVLRERSGPLAALAPLFSEGRAVSLAHAPFGDGGVIVLVERRQERVFLEEDWELLRVLSTQATAALMRVRLGLHMTAMRDIRVASALLEGSRLPAVVEHALAIAARGEPLTLTGLRLEGLEQVAAEDGDAAAERVRRTAVDVLRELTGTLGIAVERGPDDFVLVLPRLTARQTESLVGRLGRQLPARVRVRAGAVQSGEGGGSVEALLDTLDRAIASAPPTPVPR